MLNKMKNTLKSLRNKKGFITIDAILSLGVALIFFLLFLGVMFLMIPKFTMQGDVHTLAQLARIQGGLYESDIDEFKTRISKETGAKVEDIHVVLKDDNTNMRYDNISEGNYASHVDGQILQLYVIVPTNKFVQAPMKFFGMQNIENIKYYNFTETVVSEKW